MWWSIPGDNDIQQDIPQMTIPVIDLFAGPGGLGEGFSRERSVRFKVAVSIEKDGMAYETLRLRAAHRELGRAAGTSARTWAQWDEILEHTPWNTVFEELSRCGNALIEQACVEANGEALNLELGPHNRNEACGEIRKRLAPFMTAGNLPRNAVLIGGPPCQAYSIVGRSRNRGTPGYRAEEDHRHFLYMEYLHVIATFEPAVFVMENVKGILTSTVKNSHIFETILRDLKRPGSATNTGSTVEYVLCALNDTETAISEERRPDEFIVRAEDHGVPQARHRVIILGVRKDVYEASGGLRKLRRARAPTVLQVIGDLPMLRPELSYRGKGLTWLQSFEDPLFAKTVTELNRRGDGSGPRIAARMLKTIERLRRRATDPGSGGDRTRLSFSRRVDPERLAGWFQDRPGSLITNHESRSHMPSDLVRYMFVSAFGEVQKSSPGLVDFPKCLLPEHKNVNPEKLSESPFKDRFRVQVGDLHAMTITSHIAKDGHAFVHPEAIQCRSLTVREAARLQTFPDSYVFLGNRTSQYTQVGNAVPPYLARQIAALVASALIAAGLADEDLAGSPALAKLAA